MKLVVFDIETTGTDKEKDHIIQFSAVKYDKNDEKGLLNLKKRIVAEE